MVPERCMAVLRVLSCVRGKCTFAAFMAVPLGTGNHACVAGSYCVMVSVLEGDVEDDPGSGGLQHESRPAGRRCWTCKCEQRYPAFSQPCSQAALRASRRYDDLYWHPLRMPTATQTNGTNSCRSSTTCRGRFPGFYAKTQMSGTIPTLLNRLTPTWPLHVCVVTPAVCPELVLALVMLCFLSVIIVLL